MSRFLLRPRWIVGHVLLLVTVFAFVNLGLWQLRRLDERRQHNALVEERTATAPLSLQSLVGDSGDVPQDLEYRRVTVDGRYGDEQLLTAPRSVDGRPVQQVLTVLQRDGLPAVLIDRGMIPFNRDTVRAPTPPGGRVQVRGVIRAPELGDIGQATQVAHIIPRQIADRLGVGLEDAYVQLRSQAPALAAGAPQPTPLPELTEGNHLSYAMQWFSFALIALIGYPLLVRRSMSGRRGSIAGDRAVARPGGHEVSGARIR